MGKCIGCVAHEAYIVELKAKLQEANDFHDADVAELEAEVERLREALQKLVDECVLQEGDDLWSYSYQIAYEKALVALTQEGE